MADRTEMRIKGLDKALANLRALPPEIVSKRGGPVLKSLKKGARVISRQVAANLVAVTSNATVVGENQSTGLLLKSLIVTRGKPPSSGKGERVLIRFKKKVYIRASGKADTRATAAWTEYGTEDRPAEPFLRPAFAAKAQSAIDTTSAELIAEIEKVQRKLGS